MALADICLERRSLKDERAEGQKEGFIKKDKS
jgi:hypothetical protein